jgi:hypothetical protein
MAEFALIAWLTGAAISLRLRVFALVPAISFMLVVVAAAEISRGETIWWTAAATLSAAASAQLGYFMGNVLRFVMMGARRETAPAEFHLSLQRGNYHYQDGQRLPTKKNSPHRRQYHS